MGCARNAWKNTTGEKKRITNNCLSLSFQLDTHPVWETEMFVPIIYNAALLVLLVIVLDLFSGERLSRILANRVIVGLMLGIIGISVMLNPWKAVEGVVFDTRSVLLSITGLFFGLVPAAIAACLTSVYRIYGGGAGVFMGVGVIISSTAIGIIWRRRRSGHIDEISALELMTFGLLVHACMLLLAALTLPMEVSVRVISVITLPVLTVYPMVTMAIGYLLIRSLKRRQINRILRESEEKYRLLADNTIDVISILDLDIRILYLNPAIDNLLGYSAEEVIGRGLWEFCDEANSEIIKSRIESALAGFPEMGEVQFEAVMLGKDGREINVEITSRVVPDDQGNPCSLHGVTRNITERKRVETERERLRLAIEHSVEAVMITDTEGTIVYVNPAFEKTSGYSREEAIGRKTSILESGQHDQAFYDEMWEDLRSGKTWTGKFINRKKNGELFTEETSISPVFDSYGKIINFVAAKRDITYEIELEQQLWQSQKMEAIGQLAGGIAHDFNNILQAMMGYCELLKDSVDENGEQYDYVQELQKGTERAAALTKQLLAFSRRQVIQTNDVDLNEIIRNLMKMIGRTIGEHIELVHRLCDGKLFIHADSGNIEQVIMNLCVNARDAMPRGGKLVIETERAFFDESYCKSHPGVEKGYYGLITVSDTGCGIDSLIRNRIFDPFFTTKEIGRGTGLGLATAYGIVKQHKGTIQVESEKGFGSTFTVSLPLVEAEAHEEIIERALKPKGGKETVLLAEDDFEVRKMARLILENAGYRVIGASDGEKAIALLQENLDQIKIAVIDVVMPKKSGKEVLDFYHKVKPEGKVLLVSGYSAGVMDVSNMKADQAVFISKPFLPGTFLRAVRNLLDS